VLAWTIRSARIEERPPLRFLLGLLVLLTTPPKGVLHGRPVVEPRPARLDGGWVFLSSLPPGPERG
jgi:hypothetical protein